jgi:phosphate butyryltransferase (EC 2.3.1.19)
VPRRGAEALMKGSLHTDEMMSQVIKHLRTNRRISHVFLADVPTYPHPLMITDAAIIIEPTLEDKVDIIQNAIELAHILGLAEPKVAILSAVETVTSKIRSTIDAAALCKMADRGQIKGGCSTARSPSTTRCRWSPPRPRASSRSWPATPTSWWCPTSNPATWSPSSSSTSPTR